MREGGILRIVGSMLYNYSQAWIEGTDNKVEEASTVVESTSSTHDVVEPNNPPPLVAASSSEVPSSVVSSPREKRSKFQLRDAFHSSIDNSSTSSSSSSSESSDSSDSEESDTTESSSEDTSVNFSSEDDGPIPDDAFGALGFVPTFTAASPARGPFPQTALEAMSSTSSGRNLITTQHVDDDDLETGDEGDEEEEEEEEEDGEGPGRRLANRSIGPGTLYIQMEYCANNTLKDIITRPEREPKQIMSYFRQILDALSYMHSRNIIHRDVKPANIFLDSEGNAQVVVRVVYDGHFWYDRYN